MKEGWEKKKIKDVCYKGSSNIVLSKVEDNTGDYPLYGASGFVKNIDFFHNDKPYIGIVKDGSGVGRVNVYPAFSSLVGTLQYIFPKDSCSLDYLAYCLKSLDLSKFVNGAAIPHIYFKDYGECVIPVPPLSVQESIVSELDMLSGIISKHKALQEEYDRLEQSIFYDMFGDPVTNEKGWEVKKAEDLINVIGGYAFKSDCFVEDGIPILRIGNVNTGRFTTNNLVFWNEDISLKRYAIFPGDIVMSLTGTVGKDDYGNLCILDNSYRMYYLNQRNAKLELKKDLESFYILFLFKDKDFKKKLTDVSRGVRQANISNKDILNLPIPLPPLSLQQSFADKISAIEQMKAKNKAAQEEAEMLFNERMAYYF